MVVEYNIYSRELSICGHNLPFLILHGSSDVVTDPEVSREFYKLAKSTEKTLNIYDGVLHSLLLADTDENVEVVFVATYSHH